jgi:hypothetical protein
MGKRDARKPQKDKPEQVPPAQDEPKSGEGNPFPVHEHIGRQLKALFDEVTTQPIPDKFRDLLDKLDDKESKQ